MRRRDFIALFASAAAWPLVARAEGKLTRIGYLALTSPEANPEPLTAFREGMRERGYIEGQNLLIEYRWAEQPSEAVATELARLNVDVIVAWGTPAVAAAKRATSTIPSSS
jgi:putative ABC transport system substrate-binding protein